MAKATTNNNPGNLRYAGQQGAVDNGGFAQFSSPDDGYVALMNDLHGKVTGNTSTGLTPNHTLNDLASKYAPLTENDTDAYVLNLANKLKVSPDTPLSQLQERVPELANAIAHNEDQDFAKKNPLGIQTTPEQNKFVQPEQKSAENNDGLLASLFRGVTQPVVTMLARPVQAAAELAGATENQVNEASSKIPFYGERGNLDVPRNTTDVVKDVGRGAQTVALGMPVASIPQAIATGAVSGAGSGLESEGTAEGALKQGALGAGLGLMGGSISNAVKALPVWLTKDAFKGLNDSQIEKVLSEKSIGSISSLARQSEKSVSEYGNKIEEILNNTKATGAGNFSIRATTTQFPEYAGNETAMLQKIKNLIPSGKDIGLNGEGWDRATILSYIDKIQDGTATLFEKNRVKGAINSATNGGYAKLARAINPSAGQDLAMTFANNLATEVKKSAPETIPIFEEFSKEMGIKSALQKIANKKTGGIIQWRDIVPFMVGTGLGGLPGGIASAAAMRTASSPAAEFAAAKGLQGISKIISPVVNRTGILPSILNSR